MERSKKILKSNPVQKSKTAVVQKDSPLFYIVPPLVLLLIFAFCAIKSRPSSSGLEHLATQAQRAVDEKTSTKLVVKTIKTGAGSNDLNADLPALRLPPLCVNLMSKARASQSETMEAGIASNAINNNVADNAPVAAATGEGGHAAWWQAEFQGDEELQALVIYGGTAQSKQGKLYGGFEVVLQNEAGEDILRRRFCEAGFALEGYELWKFETPQRVSRVLISSLNPEYPLVLREVQAIGVEQP